MESRKEFLHKLFGAAAFATLAATPAELFARKEQTKITILHTNDVHSHIDPFPDNDPKYPGLGGVARRAALIQYIRRIEPNVLLLDAGDIFQGTPYFNKWGGEVELKLMSKMGYDASTIGNHDFDNGLLGLSSQLIHANFPLINCNYDFTDSVMQGKTIPYKIFEKDGIKIGVFGIGIELKGLVDKKNYLNTQYLDPVKKSAEFAHLLKKELKCDLVICLSHLGYKYPDDKLSDLVLARESQNIDVIIGGHTHTFLDKPQVLANRKNKEVIVSQAGWAGINLGRIDITIEKNSKRTTSEGHSIKVLNNANF